MSSNHRDSKRIMEVGLQECILHAQKTFETPRLGLSVFFVDDKSTRRGDFNHWCGSLEGFSSLAMPGRASSI